MGGEDSYYFTLAWQETNPDPPPATVEETFTYGPVAKKWYDDAIGAGTSAATVVTDGGPNAIISFTITR